MNGFSPGVFVILSRPNVITEYFGTAPGGVPILMFANGMKLIDVCKTPVKMKSIPHVPNTPRLHGFYYPHVHLEMTEYYVKKWNVADISVMQLV